MLSASGNEPLPCNEQGAQTSWKHQGQAISVSCMKATSVLMKPATEVLLREFDFSRRASALVGAPEFLPRMLTSDLML